MSFNPFGRFKRKAKPSDQNNENTPSQVSSSKLVDLIHLRDADESYQDLLEPFHQTLCSLMRKIGRHDWAITQCDRLNRDKISSEQKQQRIFIWRFGAAIAALTCLDAPQAIIGSLGIPYEDFFVKIPAAVLSFIMVTALDISVGLVFSIFEIKHRWDHLLKEAKEEAKGESGYMEYYVKGLTSLLRDVKGFDGSPSRSKLIVCLGWIACYIPLQAWGIHTAQSLYGEDQSLIIPVIGIMINLATSLYRAFQIDIPEQLDKLYAACYEAYKKTEPDVLICDVEWANSLLDYAKKHGHEGFTMESFSADLTREKVARDLQLIRQDCRDGTSEINKEEAEALKAFDEKFQTARTRKAKAVGWERPFEGEKEGIHQTFDSRRTSLKQDLFARLEGLRFQLEEIGASTQSIERMVKFVENTLNIPRQGTMQTRFIPVVETPQKPTIFPQNHELNGNGKHSTP